MMRLRNIVYHIRRYFHRSAFPNEMRLVYITYLVGAVIVKLHSNLSRSEDLQHIHRWLEVAEMLACRGSHFLEINAEQIHSTIQTAKACLYIEEDTYTEASK